MEKILSFSQAKAAQRKEYHVPPDAVISLLATVKKDRPGVYATLIELICNFSGVSADSLTSGSQHSATPGNG